MEELWNQLRLSAAQYASLAALSPVSPGGIRAPVRYGALGAYVGGLASAALPPCPAGTALGVPLIASARFLSGWITMELTPAFYCAAVEHVCLRLPAAQSDLHRHSLNRMLALARKGGTGCPDNARVQRALLTVLALADPGAPASPAHRLHQAERALEEMLLGQPPAQRPALASVCGHLGDAAARILYDFCMKHPMKGD